MNEDISFLSPDQLAAFDELVATVRGRAASMKPPSEGNDGRAGAPRTPPSMSICMECCRAMPEESLGAPKRKRGGGYRDLPLDVRRAIEEHNQNRLPNFAAGEKSFAALLLEAMKARQLDPPAVYKAAGVDRRSYSDIVNDERHPVAKLTVIRFALALHMTRGETDALLHAAGYTFSRATITDAIFDGCFEAGIYDFAKIDAIRRHYHQRALFK